MLFRMLSSSERNKAIGRAVEVTVVRDGERVTRYGTLGRWTMHAIWIGCFCYSLDEVLPTLRILNTEGLHD